MTHLALQSVCPSAYLSVFAVMTNQVALNQCERHRFFNKYELGVYSYRTYTVSCRNFKLDTQIHIYAVTSATDLSLWKTSSQNLRVRELR